MLEVKPYGGAVGDVSSVACRVIAGRLSKLAVRFQVYGMPRTRKAGFLCAGMNLPSAFAPLMATARAYLLRGGFAPSVYDYVLEACESFGKIVQLKKVDETNWALDLSCRVGYKRASLRRLLCA